MYPLKYHPTITYFTLVNKLNTKITKDENSFLRPTHTTNLFNFLAILFTSFSRWHHLNQVKILKKKRFEVIFITNYTWKSVVNTKILSCQSQLYINIKVISWIKRKLIWGKLHSSNQTMFSIKLFFLCSKVHSSNDQSCIISFIQVWERLVVLT